MKRLIHFDSLRRVRRQLPSVALFCRPQVVLGNRALHLSTTLAKGSHLLPQSAASLAPNLTVDKHS